MNPTAPDSVPTTPTTSLRSRVAHEVLCATIAGIFCMFEVLILLTEFRAAKLFHNRRAPGSKSAARKK